MEEHKILVVDDNKDFADVFCDILKANNYKAESCYSGMQAIELIKETVSLIINLYNLFEESDCSLAEINPLVITKEEIEQRLTDMMREMLRDFNQEDSIISLTYDEKNEQCTVKMNVAIVDDDDYVGFSYY